MFSVNVVALLLFTGAVAAQEYPFRGTWKLDTADHTTHLPAAADDSPAKDMEAIRLNRIKSIRYFLNETECVIVIDGIPNTIAWTCTPDGESKYVFTKSTGIERFIIEVIGNDRIDFHAFYSGPSGEHKTTFPLIRVSADFLWEPPPVLTIGMTAPEIVADNWLHAPTRAINFGDGRVYLIAFWATWCAPCLQKMPQLVDLQDEIGQEKLGIVAITSENPEDVSRFLVRKEEVGDRSDNSPGQRVFEMSKTIAIGVDKEHMTFRSYMVASEFRAIPSMFIVGKTGLIEWAGSAEDGENVLRLVLSGSWDRDEFAKRFVGIQKAYKELPRLHELLRAGKIVEVHALIAELEQVADEPVKEQLNSIKASLSGVNHDK